MGVFRGHVLGHSGLSVSLSACFLTLLQYTPFPSHLPHLLILSLRRRFAAGSGQWTEKAERQLFPLLFIYFLFYLYGVFCQQGSRDTAICNMAVCLGSER